MSEWSVDGIHLLGGEHDHLSVVRFVHVNDPFEMDASGVRYFAVEKPMLETVPHGRCIALGSTTISSNKEGMPMALLSGVSNNAVRRKTEAELRKKIQGYLDEAGNFKGESREESESLDPSGIFAKIHVHNVGQGDTIVLELPDDQIWMVDARLWGTPRRKEFDDWMKQFRHKTFTKLIVSHMHYDHIHSVPYIIDAYDPDEVVVPDSLVHPTATALRVVARAGDKLRKLNSDQTVKLGDLEIMLTPSSQFGSANSIDPNDHEVGICLKTPTTNALLAGDMPADQCIKVVEQHLPETSENTYYKVSHHGSRTGYSDSFISSLSPKYSVVSCGKNNRYNHPHVPPLNLLPGAIYRTAEMDRGDVDVFNVK